MGYDDITAMLEEVGLPFAYDHFSEGEAPEPPFVVFLLPASHNFAADGRAYQKIDEVHIELYTDRKQPDLEGSLESVLDAHGIFYGKTEAWISEERLYEVLYTFQVARTDM